MSEEEHVVTPAKAGPKGNGSDSESLKRVEKALLALWLNKTLIHLAKYPFSLGLAKREKNN